MKKVLAIIMVSLFTTGVIHAQDDKEEKKDLYLMIDFMKVDNTQEGAYAETEKFWSKIHQQRANNGHINGWDLWSLNMSAEDQGFQYMTIQLFNDPSVMMNSGDTDQLMLNAKQAYPDMTEEQIQARLDKTGLSRDLSMKLYIQVVSATEKDAYTMPAGTIAQMDIMKVALTNTNAYEDFEENIFKPAHQKVVDDGKKERWSLLKVLSPTGSDTYTSHITMNFFEDYSQLFTAGPVTPDESTDEKKKAVTDGMSLRDHKFTYMCKLLNKIRKEEKQ